MIPSSRWQRPNLYLTIVGFYLLVCVSIGLAFIGIIVYQNSQDTGSVPLGGIVFLPLIVGIILLVTIPSLIAMVLLFLKRRRGWEAAIVAMFFLSFVVIYLGIGFLYQALMGELQADATAAGVFRVSSPIFLAFHVLSGLFLWKGRSAFRT